MLAQKRLAFLLLAAFLVPLVAPLLGGAPGGTEVPEVALEDRAAAAEAAGRADPGYDLVHGGSGYHIVTTGATWDAARADALAQGGDLVVLETAAENTAVLNALIAAGVSTTAGDGGGGTYAWIGANDTDVEDTWDVVDGTTLPGAAGIDTSAPHQTHAPWGDGPMGTEPDDFGSGQDCAALGLSEWPSGVTPGQGIGIAGEWNDVDCSNSLAYVIEVDRRSHRTGFAGGANETDLRLNLVGATGVSRDIGNRTLAATVDVTGEATAVWQNRTLTQTTLNPLGNASGTVIFGQQRELTRLGSSGGGLTYGSTDLTIIGLYYLNGTHAFRDIFIGCGIVPPCGTLIINGSATITARSITIANGGAIEVFGNATSGPGHGGNISNTWSPSGGAGGGGYGGNGGSGGGTGGASGGGSYANGSTSGSPGGHVNYTDVNSNTGTSWGGDGGANVHIMSDSLTVSGTITVDGDEGDAGYSPPQTHCGDGNDGAGGGSGGRLLVQANTITVNQGGSISADGGDGGDGGDANGQGQGACLFLYNGGNGGGGGAGGRITLQHSVTGSATVAAGAISVNGGSGGTGGRAAGTGSPGVAGSAASAGQYLNTTFAGFSAGNFTDTGNWSVRLNGTDVLRDTGWSWQTSTPTNTTLSMQVRTSVDGSNWTAWTNASTSESNGPRFRDIEFHFEFATSENTSTPTVGDLTLWGLQWGGPTNVSVDIGAGPSGAAAMLRDGERAEIGVGGPFVASLVAGEVRLPVGALPVADAVVRLTGTGNVSSVLGDAVALNLSAVGPLGVDVQVPMANVSAWLGNQTLTYAGTHGFVSAPVAVGDNWTAAQLSLPLNATHRALDLGPALSAWSAAQGGWAAMTLTTIPLLITSDVTTDVRLSNVSTGSVDDLAPVVLQTLVRVNGQPLDLAHENDLVTVLIQVLHSESDLNVSLVSAEVNLTGVWTSRTIDPVRSTLMWNGSQQLYVFDLNTSAWSHEHGEYRFCFELVDTFGNARLDGDACATPDAEVDIAPAYPAFSSVGVGPALSTSATIEVGDRIELTAYEADGRTDLHVQAVLLRQTDAGDRRTFVLPWNASMGAYHGQAEVGRAEIGVWDVRFDGLDVRRDEPAAARYSTLTVEDATAPVGLNASIERIGTSGSAWRVNASWEQAFGEEAVPLLELRHPDGSLAWSGDLIASQLALQGGPTSVVMVGSSTAAGSGASQPSLSVAGRIEAGLEGRYGGDVSLTNVASGGATIVEHRTRLGQIQQAAPDIIVVMPWTDFAQTDHGQFRDGYAGFLNDLEPLGADLYFAMLRIDPQDVCTIGGGPGGCYSANEFDWISLKTTVITELAADRDWVHIVDVTDTNAQHPEWNALDGHPNDTGHGHLAGLVLDEIQADWDELRAVATSTVSVDTSFWPYGNHTGEVILRDGSGNTAPDGVRIGPDLMFELVEPPPPPVPSVLSVVIGHPGEGATLTNASLPLEVVASCDDGCPLEALLLVTAPDATVTEHVLSLANGTALGVPLTLLADGAWHLRLTVWSNDSLAAPVSVERNLTRTTPPPAAPVLAAAACTATSTITGGQLADANGTVRNATWQVWTISCQTNNTGDADGQVRLRLVNHADDLTCGPALTLAPAAAETLTCTWAITELDASSTTLALEVEGRADNASAWDGLNEVEGLELALQPPVFEPIEVPEDDDETTGGSGGFAGLGTPMVAGLGLVTLLVIGAIVGAVLFLGGRGSAPAPFAEPVRVDSYEALPAGGEYVMDGGTTVYVTGDGERWRQLPDGGFELE